MSNDIRRSGLATLVLLLIGSTTVSAENPRAEWIASDAAVFLEVLRPAGLLDRLKGQPTSGLLESIPNYRAYLHSDDYLASKKNLEAVTDRLGTTWDQGLLKLVGGGLVIAIEPSTPPRAFLIATPSDPAFAARALETFLEMARADAQAKGGPDPVASAEHRGIRGYAMGLASALALIDGSIVVASSPEALKLVIDRSIDRPDASKTLAGEPLWQAQRKVHAAGEATAWSMVRVDRLRQFDPNFLKVPESVNPLATLLFADWVEMVRKAPWISASLTFTADRLAAELTLPTPPGGFSDALKRFLPSNGKGATSPIAPAGMIASVALWRDLSSLWEVRSDLFTPEVVQGLAQLDTFAGTFFGGRDFGTGVLGAVGTNWRLVVARQDYAGFDPVPADKLPAFALVADLKPDDEDFAVRLKSAFQSFVGLVNLGAAQTKAPPLMLGSETLDGISIATSKFLKTKAKPGPVEPVNSRHNFSPSAAQVGDHFILGSSLGLVRDLIPSLKAPAAPTDATLLVQADGETLAGLIVANRPRLIMQNMLEKGNDKPKAETEVDFLTTVVRTLGRGDLSATDSPEGLRLRLNFLLQKP